MSPGKLVEEEEGNFALWLSYILTGVGANLVSWLVLPRNSVSIGASGAVFGLFVISVLVKVIQFLYFLLLIWNLVQGYSLWRDCLFFWNKLCFCLMLCLDILGLEEDPSSTYIGTICNTKCKPTLSLISFCWPLLMHCWVCVVF